MSKRGVGAVVALVVVAVLAVWLWRRDAHRTAGAKPGTGSGGRPLVVVTPRGSNDPATGVPRWYGAPGISGRRIAGIVVAEDGTPIAGATVRLASRLSAAGLLPPAKQPSDAGGHFDFGVQPATYFIVSAEQPKLTATLVKINVADTAANPAPDHLRLVMHPCTASIHGTIFDMAGGPIPHAFVARMALGAETAVGVEADDTGAYELCVAVGADEVRITADGYAPATEEVQVYGRTRRDFQLVPGTPVAGTVVRADDKSPVAGAIVELHVKDPRGRGDTLLASSGDDGRFHFDAVAPGRHEIEAHAERLATRDPVAVSVEVGSPLNDVVVALDATYTVSGRIVERGTQKGIAGQAVYLVAPSSSGMRIMRKSAAWSQSAGDGSFTLEDVAPGTYMPILRGTDFSASDKHQSIEVNDKDVTGVIVESDAMGSIAGRIMLDGKPVDGALVRTNGEASSSNDTSASDGSFELTNLSAGSYELYAQSNRVGAFTHGPTLTLAAGEHKTGIDVELDLAGSISGVVVDQNEQPVPGVFLTFSLLKGQDFGSATTADDGSFTANALSGGGDYIYEVKQSERSTLVYAPASGRRFPPIAVADGKTHVSGVRIKIKYERLAISGRVVDAGGNPVPDARITAAPQEELGWWRPPAATMSDQTGAFTIRDLTSGEYTIEAATNHGTADADHVAAGATNVVLKLRGAGGIDGTLEGFTETPEVSAFSFDDYENVNATVRGATFQLRNLPPGRYRVMARTKTETEGATVEVRAEQIATVKLFVHAKGAIKGTLVDAKTHAPLPNLNCFAAPVGKADEVIMGPRAPTQTDASGAFTIESVSAGENRVTCWGENTSAWGTVTVAAGQTATIELTADKQGGHRGRDIGMELENQLSQVVVTAVGANGPAAKAGIAAGDTIVSVDGRKVGRYQAEMIEKQLEYDDKNEHAIVLGRNDKDVTVTLKLDPAPSP